MAFARDWADDGISCSLLMSHPRADCTVWWHRTRRVADVAGKRQADGRDRRLRGRNCAGTIYVRYHNGWRVGSEDARLIRPQQNFLKIESPAASAVHGLVQILSSVQYGALLAGCSADARDPSGPA